jgi:hypothetical protein
VEWLTGGECLAGMHEVVVTKRTLDAIALAKEQNRSLWRVSSTVSTINSSTMLIRCSNLIRNCRSNELSTYLFPFCVNSCLRILLQMQF